MKTINIKFPVLDDTEKNTFLNMNALTKEALTSNLLLLLLTEKGERYYLPDYGTNLKRFLFEANDGITLSELQEDIKETVRKYIPQLSIQNIRFLTQEEDDSVGDNDVMMLIDFTYTDDVFSEVNTLRINI